MPDFRYRRNAIARRGEHHKMSDCIKKAGQIDATTDTRGDAANDAFTGAERIRRLSEKLMNWYEQPVNDQEIIDVLGQEALEPFRFAQQRLEGRVRKVTLEPAFCHSADVALRAAELMLGAPAIRTALLHDVVEDCSKNPRELADALSELQARFEARVSTAVELLTNRYKVIFSAILPKLRSDLPFDARSGKAFAAALEVLRFELPSSLSLRFENELTALARFFAEKADYVSGAHIVKRDKKFTLAISLERQIYRVYVDDIVARAAAERHTADSPGRLALLVKLLDIMDNIRTSEISNRLSLFKLMNKAEATLDSAHALLELDSEDELFVHLVRLLELRLVDQLDARCQAVAQHFAETRFAGLVGFLREHSSRLANKYAVGEDRLAQIVRLQAAIRRVGPG